MSCRRAMQVTVALFGWRRHLRLIYGEVISDQPEFSQKAPWGGGHWSGFSKLDRLHEQIAWANPVHIHGRWTIPTSFGASLARLRGTPCIVTPHGMLDR